MGQSYLHDMLNTLTEQSLVNASTIHNVRLVESLPVWSSYIWKLPIICKCVYLDAINIRA